MSDVRPPLPGPVPTLRYRDATAAVDWLARAFGFTERLVVRDGEGRVVHAQLAHGAGMIMLGRAGDDEFGRLQKPPAGPDAPVTMSAYLVVEDADRHRERALAAGATIAMEIRDEDYGGRVYSCRDPEGHLWNFGTYDPFAG